MAYNHDTPFQCMDDCIHLKACRRLQKIAKSKWLSLPRYCSEECTAYETAVDLGEVVSIEQALDYARGESYLIQEGYDPYDVFLSSELSQYSTADAVRLIPGENNNDKEQEYQEHYKRKSHRQKKVQKDGWEDAYQEMIRIADLASPLRENLGISEYKAEHLCEAGIDTIEKIANASESDLLKVHGFGVISVKKLKDKASEWEEKHNDEQSD